MNRFLNSIRHDQSKLPILDPTTTYFEFLSYVECCRSLNKEPSITKFVKYNKLWNKNFKER